MTTLLSLLYSSSSSSSSGDPAVPLRLLTRGAKRPGEVGSHPGGKWQKSALYWGGRDQSPRGEQAGARGQEPGWQELPTAPRGHQPGTALVGKLQTSDLSCQPPAGLPGPSACFSELSVCLSGGPLPPPASPPSLSAPSPASSALSRWLQLSTRRPHSPQLGSCPSCSPCAPTASATSLASCSTPTLRESCPRCVLPPPAPHAPAHSCSQPTPSHAGTDPPATRHKPLSPKVLGCRAPCPRGAGDISAHFFMGSWVPGAGRRMEVAPVDTLRHWGSPLRPWHGGFDAQARAAHGAAVPHGRQRCCPVHPRGLSAPRALWRVSPPLCP